MKITKAAFLILFVALLIIGTLYRRLTPVKPAALGIDANTNGVWDDVDVAIATKMPESKKKRAALTQMARALQRGIENPDQAYSIADDADRALVCLDYVGWEYIEGDISDQVESELTNTPARAEAYLRFNLNLSGTVSPINDYKPGDCDFSVEEMEN